MSGKSSCYVKFDRVDALWQGVLFIGAAGVLHPRLMRHADGIVAHILALTSKEEEGWLP